MFLLTHHVWGSMSAALERTHALAQAEVAQLLGTSERGRQLCFLREDFRLKILKEFREIPGRQRHIWFVMKVTNVWGNILYGVGVLDGVGGEGTSQAFLSPLSWAGPGGGGSWAGCVRV